jgi:ribonuclease HI
LAQEWMAQCPEKAGEQRGPVAAAGEDLAEIHEIQWIKVKGHSDNKYNNRCDALARAAIEAGR